MPEYNTRRPPEELAGSSEEVLVAITILEEAAAEAETQLEQALQKANEHQRGDTLS